MMKNLREAFNCCVLMILLGVCLTFGIKLMEFLWPKNETVRIVHYLCVDDGDGDVTCGKIKDADIGSEIRKIM